MAVRTGLEPAISDVTGQRIYRFYFRTFISGREDGIRTHGTLLTFAPLAGECFRPLSHLSICVRLYPLDPRAT